MNWVVFIIVGIIAGWLAGQIYKGSGFGLIRNLVVGVVGSVIGGWLWGVLFNNQVIVGNIYIDWILSAVAGALVLLFLINLVKK